MAETLDEKTRAILTAYLREVRTLPNEAAKRQRFAALLGELFPGQKILTEFARGAERLIRIKTADGTRRGYADNYYGNAIIEFEDSLDATLAVAEKQLREYVSGLWAKKGEDPRNLTAIASDGIEWRIYHPRLREGAGSPPQPGDVTLEFPREIRLAEGSLGDFWLWLNQVLFRPQQVPPTAARFQIDFGTLSPLYLETMAALSGAWESAKREPESRLAFETWQKYLAVTYGGLPDPTDPRLRVLFLKHTYLCSLARLLVWAALSKGKATKALGKVAQDVLSGEYFQSAGLANLVEDDFFHWIRRHGAAAALAPFWQRILAHVLDYDLAALDEDVLKGVYQQLIDPEDRHDLGEYYTPDWLCERIVAEMLPKLGFKPVLDPSCGSGSFLRAAIARYKAANPEAKGAAGLRKFLENVQGIDIHPVAVTIARATYVLALGPLAKAARRPIQIPVYLADSLFLPREVEADLLDKLRGIEVTYGQRPGARKVVMPEDLIRAPKLFDEAIAACAAVAEDHAATGKETRRTLANHLAQAVPDLGRMLHHDAILDALWQFAEGLAGLIRDRRNSIWAFIVRNSYRPAMLRGQFDVIIGNPPWLSYRYIADPEYQGEIKKRAVDDYRIAPKSQKLFTQMELATVFMAHAMAVFARPGARIGFVMPRGVLSADQHQNLILRKYRAPSSNPKGTFLLTGYWDLVGVAPLFNVPACVLFGERAEKPGDPSDGLAAVLWNGNLPERNATWPVAKQTLTARAAEARVIYLGSRCAISTEKGAAMQAEPSPYQKEFRQGATIVPRSFYFVRANDLDGAPDPERSYWIETDPVQAREAKPPYQDVALSGLMEGRFLFSALIAKHILPFAVLPPATVALPIEVGAEGLAVITADAMNQMGYRDAAKWFRLAEAIWAEKRGNKAERQSLYEWLDYQGKLTAQDFGQRHLVLYNTSGTNVAAACPPPTMRPLADATLYWAALATADEANYVCAILNSATVNNAIKPFQARGFTGAQRHVHKKLLEVPIPRFDAREARHRRLAELGARANADSARIAPTLTSSRLLGRQRSEMRKALGTILAEIDGIVGQILG
jgi:hypothetical protein